MGIYPHVSLGELDDQLLVTKAEHVNSGLWGILSAQTLKLKKIRNVVFAQSIWHDILENIYICICQCFVHLRYTILSQIYRGANHFKNVDDVWFFAKRDWTYYCLLISAHHNFCESLYHGDVSSECIPEGNILYTSMISVTTKVMNVILDYQYFFYFE